MMPLVQLELASRRVEVRAGLVVCAQLLEGVVPLLVCFGNVGGVLGKVAAVVVVELGLVLRADFEWLAL